jgi:hypothetical protein
MVIVSQALLPSGDGNDLALPPSRDAAGSALPLDSLTA